MYLKIPPNIPFMGSKLNSIKFTFKRIDKEKSFFSLSEEQFKRCDNTFAKLNFL